MSVERALRGMAGLFVLLSVVLGYFVHPGFYLFTAFVGANLLQSAFSNWCPAMWMLRKAGLKDSGGANAVASGGGSEPSPSAR
jgi:hypothetical protein